MFGIFIDPTKCKGCAECVQVCDDNALKMIKKTDTNDEEQGAIAPLGSRRLPNV